MPDEDVVRFGDDLELDPAAYELRRSGRPLKLERIPFETLKLLIERRPHLVSREDIITRIWGKDVFLDTDTSINSAIRKIRQVLKDDPENPAFIQTVTGKGYRFIAPVTILGNPVPSTPATPLVPPVTQLDIPQPASPVPSEQQSAARKGLRRGWLGIPVGAAILVAFALFVWRLSPKPTLPPMSAPQPLTTYRGSQSVPSLSPDGNQVAFQWDGEKEDNVDIYVKALGPDATPLRLTTNPAPDRWPAWSPDGTTIAFLRTGPTGKIDLMLIPALGGPERKLAEFPVRPNAIGLHPAWSPDNKWIIVPAQSGDTAALFRVSVDTGESIQITTPDSGLEDLFPAISPDGTGLVFTRVHQMYVLGDLYLVHLDANAKPTDTPRRIAEGNKTEGLSCPVWTPDGKQILARTFAGAVRLPADGSAEPTQMAWVGPNPNFLDVSRRGNRLAFSVQRGDANIYRIDLTAKVPSPEPIVASTERDVYPQYSPDGTRLAFYSYRTGLGQIWIADAEGKQPRQLTFVANGQAATPHWSPDGKMMAIDSNVSGVSEVYTINPDGGKMTPLTQGPYANFSAVWSHDGKWMYFTSKRTGLEEVWKMPDGGGPAIQLTHNGGSGAIESFDGKTLYFAKTVGAGSIWEMPVTGGPEQQLADSLFRTNFAVTRRGIYYMTSPDFSRKSTLKFYNFATQQTTTILPMGIPEFGLDVSPDGRYLAYDQLDDPGSVLMLIENFR
jgi:Tol biopolymer transport system component/DNA-binding winged helix-turn-helix (wHTH) protein